MPATIDTEDPPANDTAISAPLSRPNSSTSRHCSSRSPDCSSWRSCAIRPTGGSSVAPDSGEANVRNLIQIAQVAHHLIANRRRRHFLLVHCHQRSLDIVGEPFELLRRHRPTVAGRTHAAHHLLAVVRLALAILLDDGQTD